MSDDPPMPPSPGPLVTDPEASIRPPGDPAAVGGTVLAETPDPPWLARIPAERCYWAVLPPGGPTIASAARFRLERALPVDIDSLQGVQVPRRDGGWLYVGIQPDQLRQYLSESRLGPAVWALVPDRVPPVVPSDAVADPLHLNLLHGAFEPATRRRARRVLATSLVLGSATVACLLIIGGERQRAHRLAQASVIQAATASRIDQVVPPVAGEMLSASDRLERQIRRLEATGALVDDPAQEVAVTTQVLMSRVPHDLRIQVEGGFVAPDRVSLRVRVPTLVEAERLHRAWAEAPVPYRAEPFQASQGDGFSLLTVTMVRRAPGAGR